MVTTCRRRTVGLPLTVLLVAACQLAAGENDLDPLIQAFDRKMLYLIVASKDLQKELGLTEAQVKEMEKVCYEWHDHFQEVARVVGNPEEFNKRNAKLQQRCQELLHALKPEAKTRLRQVYLQQMDKVSRLKTLRTLVDLGLDAELKLTAEQKAELKALEEKRDELVFAEIFRAYQAIGGGKPPDDLGKVAGKAGAAVAKIHKELDRQAEQLLNPEQRDKYQRLLGKPFTGKIEDLSKTGGHRRLIFEP